MDLAAVPRAPREPSERARGLIFAYTGSQKVLLWIGLAFFLMGLPFVLVFGWGVPVDLAIALPGPLEVDAEVLSTRLRTDVTINERHPTEVRFRYRVGEASFEGESSTTDRALLAEAVPGARVAVEVSRLRPDWARVAGTTRSIFGYFGLFTIIFPAVGFGMAAAAIRSNRREIHAFTRGVAARGRVVERGPDTSTKVNGRHPHRVRWEFEAEDGRTYEGSLTHMERALLDEALPGDEVAVLYDRMRPATNTAWIGPAEGERGAR